MLNSAETVKKDFRATVPYLQKGNIEQNLELLKQIQALADKKGCTLAQLCIAWVMAQVSLLEVKMILRCLLLL